MAKAYPDSDDLLRGTLDLLILRTLQAGPQHGHGVGVAIASSSDDVLQVDHGSLYPALHRLERRGWIDAEWGLTENKQRAKFYRLRRRTAAAAGGAYRWSAWAPACRAGPDPA